MMPSEPQKIMQPREHKAKVCIWGDLTVSDLDALDMATTAKDVKVLLADILSLGDYNDNMKTDILLDLYCYTILFAREQNFTKEQTSALFSIVKKTHEICIETPFGNVQQCFNYFKEAILCHAVKRPPYSIDVFNSADQVRAITDYVINTYFRHFKMYKYVFTPLVRLDLSMTYQGMPVSEPDPPAVTEEVPEENPADVNQTEATDSQDAAEKQEEDLSPAAKELKALIQLHLSEEIKKLRASVDEQIKQTDEIMNKKLSTVEGSSAGKQGRAPSRGKKK